MQRLFLSSVHDAGSSSAVCDSVSESEYDADCFVYSHVYNNLMHGADAYNNDANFLYSDVAVAGNTYEKNVMYGSEAKVAIL